MTPNIIIQLDQNLYSTELALHDTCLLPKNRLHPWLHPRGYRFSTTGKKEHSQKNVLQALKAVLRNVQTCFEQWHALWISGLTWMRSLTLISSSLNDLVLIYKNTWNDTLISVSFISVQFSGNYISITGFLMCNLIGLGFSGGSVGRICLQCRRFRRHRFDPWVGKMP